uniref:Uncharacterized protein n=1 Tax=Acrobeloides nanus TaxID=290746 RepID=A0A914EDD2_9BILA
MNITDLLAYVDVNLDPNTYHYVVTAETSSGESAPTNIATVIADPLKLNTWLKFDESSEIAKKHEWA